MAVKTASRLLLLALCILLSCAPSLAQEPARIGELSYLDRQFMAQQQALLEDLTTRHFGRRFNRQRDNDLELLQLLLDRRLVRPEQTRELQAMGVILGDLLAAELDLHWVVYEDNLGRSRALRDDISGTYLFPMTMISRRREVDDLTPVSEIYGRASGIIKDGRSNLPFQ